MEVRWRCARRAHPGRHLWPAIEDQLRDHDLHMRKPGRPYRLPTLGVAGSRAFGGHYATLYTHIDVLWRVMRGSSRRAGTIEGRVA